MTLKRVQLADWEVDALLAMDAAWLSVPVKVAAEEPDVSARPLSPKLFDALF